MTALVARPAPRSWRRRSALLAWCIAACASGAACAHAYPDNRDATASATAYPLAEQESIPAVGLEEESRLATYLWMHYATDHGVVTLYPLAALVALTRRTRPDSHGSPRDGRYALARRAGVGADAHALPVVR